MSVSLTAPVACSAPSPPGDLAEPVLQSGIQSGPLEQLAPRSAERDAALADLLRRYHGTVWRTLRRLGVDTDRVDDAAQEVFIVAARHFDRINPGCERSYLLGAAVRIAANFRRAGRARREVFDETAVSEQRDSVPDADQLLYRKRLRQCLDDLLASWPAELRTVFVLFELEGLSVPEIAELTEVKTGTVASRLRRARELFLAAVKRLKARGLLEGGGE